MNDEKLDVDNDNISGSEAQAMARAMEQLPLQVGLYYVILIPL